MSSLDITILQQQAVTDPSRFCHSQLMAPHSHSPTVPTDLPTQLHSVHKWNALHRHGVKQHPHVRTLRGRQSSIYNLKPSHELLPSLAKIASQIFEVL